MVVKKKIVNRKSYKNVTWRNSEFGVPVWWFLAIICHPVVTVVKSRRNHRLYKGRNISTVRKKSAAGSGTSISRAALPSFDVNVNYVSTFSRQDLRRFRETRWQFPKHSSVTNISEARAGERCVLDITPAGRRPPETEDSWTPIWHEQVTNLTVNMI